MVMSHVIDNYAILGLYPEAACKFGVLRIMYLHISKHLIYTFNVNAIYLAYGYHHTLCTFDYFFLPA